jgi:hypothetical protein
LIDRARSVFCRFFCPSINPLPPVIKSHECLFFGWLELGGLARETERGASGRGRRAIADGGADGGLLQPPKPLPQNSPPSPKPRSPSFSFELGSLTYLTTKLFKPPGHDGGAGTFVYDGWRRREDGAPSSLLVSFSARHGLIPAPRPCARLGSDGSATSSPARRVSLTFPSPDRRIGASAAPSSPSSPSPLPPPPPPSKLNTLQTQHPPKRNTPLK